MLLSLLTALSLALPAAAQDDRTGTFIGCVGDTGQPLDTVAVSTGTLESCSAECGKEPYADQKGPYIIYLVSDPTQPDNNYCMCSFTGPIPLTAEQGPVGSSPWAPVTLAPQGQCDWVVYPDGAGAILTFPVQLQTDTWDFNSCASSVTPLGASTVSTVASVAACWASCTSYNYASMDYGTNTCVCADYFSYHTASCSATSSYIWPKRGLPNASALSRRRARGLAIGARNDLDTPCPRGLQACRIPHGGVECLDTAAELESCGGCVLGSSPANVTSGKDCTALAGVHPHAVTCQQGTCVVKRCRPGWTLVDGGCVKA